MLRASILAVLAIATLGACQPQASETPDTTETDNPNPVQVLSADYSFRSAVNDRDYRLSVMLPPGYIHGGETRYPVFYVYDGVGPNRGQLVALSQALAPQTPPIIWVGVGPGSDQFWDAERAADTTPTSRPAFDEDTRGYIAEAAANDGKPLTPEQLAALPAAGQAGVFLDVLETEIIPLIDSIYPTSADRAIGGHSFSGLLAGYALLERPSLFQRYLISSPSFWWDDYTMLERTEAFAETSPTLNARVFLSVGGVESEDMLSSKRRFDEILSAQPIPGLTLESREFEGANHGTVVLPAFMNGVPHLYADPDPPTD